MKRFLIADNADIVRKVVSRILTQEGTIVHEATGGTEAVEQCSFEMPELVIISTTIADRSAEDTIAEIRAMANEDNKSPIILVCMTEMNVAEIMRCKRVGADGYILKPFTRPLLLDALAQYETKAAA